MPTLTTRFDIRQYGYYHENGLRKPYYQRQILVEGLCGTQLCVANNYGPDISDLALYPIVDMYFVCRAYLFRLPNKLLPYSTCIDCLCTAGETVYGMESLLELRCLT